MERVFFIMTKSRILHYLGLAACLLLAASCFMPWAFYNDPAITDVSQRTFTGFYSYQNYYGKPGKFLCFFAGLSLLLKLLPKVGAKRVDLFLCALGTAYALKAFFEYRGVYGGVVPQTLIGLYLMLGACLLIMVAAIFPDLKIVEKKG
jgi:hypothetical protein